MSDPKSATPATPAAAHDLPRLIERMHRRYLDVVRLELGKIAAHDISPVQALMLSNIGGEEISVRDLIERGYYLGSNASYNLKHLVEGGYVERQASARDKRAARLKLSDKGRRVLDHLHQLDLGFSDSLGGDELDATYRLLRKLERRWSDAVRYADDLSDEI